MRTVLQSPRVVYRLAASCLVGVVIAAAASTASARDVKAVALGTSSYAAGYYASPGAVEGVSGASATMKVPSASCTRTPSGAVEFGIQTLTAGDAAGEAQAVVGISCQSGVLTYEAVSGAGTAPSTTSIPVTPGDTLRLSVSETATEVVSRIFDDTSGDRAITMGAPNPAPFPPDDQVLVGAIGFPEALGGLPVPTFGKVAFTNVYVNSTNMTDFPLTGDNLQQGTDIEISTSAIKSTAGGSSFTTTFQNNT